jgi:hypothetical protein
MAIFLASLLVAPWHGPLPAADTRPASRPAPPILQKIFVVGASASAGFQFDRSAPKPLRGFVDAMLQFDHVPVQGGSTELFFLTPDRSGAALIDDAESKKATLVIAVDFLFWFGYGLFRNEDDRLVSLNRGLELLEMLDCPVVTSELPDMSAAIGIMLQKAQVPQKETFAKLNGRIRQWASTRKNVILVDLPSLLDRLRNGEELEIRGNRYEKGSTSKLLQADHLHPTGEGAAILAVMALDAVVRAHKLDSTLFEWNARILCKAAGATGSRPAAGASRPAR